MDGSKHSRWALQWVARLPLKKRPRITALHVTDLSALMGPFTTPPGVAGPELINQTLLQSEVQLLEKRARQVVAETKRLLASLKLKGQVRWLRGPVAETILREAGRESLIVMGSLGTGVWKQLLLGSVSMRVLLHASSPVLVVKQPPRALRRVLVAVDGSKASDKTLDFVRRELAPAVAGGKVTAIVGHVMPPVTVSAAVAPGLMETARTAAEALAEAAAAKLEKSGFRVEMVVREGQPADQILKAAQQHRAELVVCGAKGMGAVAAFLLGSISLRVAEQSRHNALVLR